MPSSSCSNVTVPSGSLERTVKHAPAVITNHLEGMARKAAVQGAICRLASPRQHRDERGSPTRSSRA
jgi:hypothetical protein